MILYSLDVSCNPKNNGYAVWKDKRLKFIGGGANFEEIYNDSLYQVCESYRAVLAESQRDLGGDEYWLALDYPLMFPYEEREKRSGPRANLNDLAKNHQAIGAIRVAFRLPPQRVLVYHSSDSEVGKDINRIDKIKRYQLDRLGRPITDHMTDAIKIGEWGWLQLQLPEDVRQSLANLK